MEDHLPLLVFPNRRNIQPETGSGKPIGQPHFPIKTKQINLVTPQLVELEKSFSNYRAAFSNTVSGYEPEAVLVIEIIGSVEDFKQAVEALELEWIGEWDLDDIEPDDDFYSLNNKKKRSEKPLTGRLFLSMSSQAGLQKLISLWKSWCKGDQMPHGQGKWKNVFSQLRTIRRWGIEETLRETGMIFHWEDLLEPIATDQPPVTFQIELFYRKEEAKRKQNESVILAMLQRLGGKALGVFVDIKEIAFHAVKAELPNEAIKQLISELNSNSETNIELFNFSGVMYFRPTGQALVTEDDAEGEPIEIFGSSIKKPVAALFDGAPMLQHQALKDRIDVDDIFDLERHYQPGERKHGTSMASLIMHGDLGSESVPLDSRLYCIPVMQPDKDNRSRNEHMPDDVFFEDRIHIAVRRLFDGTGNTPAQAPTVKVINLSIGDSARLFIHTPSPWARLLDWLSYKYRVLFCVSAGNYSEPIEIDQPYSEFSRLNNEKKTHEVLHAINQTLSSRRLLSPAESLNAITVGAQHVDSSESYSTYNRIDLIPIADAISPVSRMGHGFRHSIKPEILFSGGRQLYKTPFTDSGTSFQIDNSYLAPGHKVAWDSSVAGETSNSVFTRGTSNATALATRSAVKIHDMLVRLREQEGQDLPEPLITVLMKALLVHGARQPSGIKQAVTAALKAESNPQTFKRVISRYLGYGAVDIERVLRCTEQRATVLGCDEIRENEIHEYEFPLPAGLSAQKHWRRLVVTLAWFSPINPDHRNLREAKLNFEPGGSKWKDAALKLERTDGDHNQVLKGTVQHEVLEGKKIIAAYEDGEILRIRVVCKKDATAHLDETIPYGLAVTLEVKEDIDIPVYQQIKNQLNIKVTAT